MKKYPYKVIESSFGRDGGYSCVTIQTARGNFTGKAYCSAEDMENNKCSRFIGGRIAEIRAYTKYLKVERNYLKAQWKAIADFGDQILGIRSADQHKFIYSMLSKELLKYADALQEINQVIEAMPQAINNLLEEREKAVKHILDRRGQNENN